MSTAITSEIVKEFVELVETDKEYDLKELKKILDEIYKTKTGTKKTAKAAKKPAKTATETETDSDDEPIKPKKTKATKTKKMDTNEEKPKRAPTAYNNYIKMLVPQLKEERPDIPPKSLLKEAAALWKTLTKQEQESYKQ